MDIGEILIGMGLTPNVAGFREMIAAVEEYRKNYSVQQKEVCDTLAEKFGTKSANIYRTLHYVVNKLDTETDFYRAYIGNRRVPLAEFTSILAYRTREKDND